MPTFRTEDGAELYYQVEGKGGDKPPLIFIHGWCCNLNHWEPQVAYFQESHRILRLDRRGMGKSTTTGTEHTPQQHAADIAAIAQHEGFTNAVAIAHAGGAPAGVYLSQGYPGLVKAYIMVDAGVGPGADLEHPSEMRDRFFAELIEKLVAPGGEKYFRELYTSFFGAQADKGLVEAVVEEASRTPVEVRVREVSVMAADTATPAAAMLQPVLVIVSPWLAKVFAQFVDQTYVDSCFRQVELARAIGTGHFVQLEVPDQVNAFIRSFVSRLT